MRNLLGETPDAGQHGRAAFARTFVDPQDIVGRDLLDVGCGFGGFAYFALACGARSVTGVEPTEADLLTVRRNLDDPRVSFRVASAHELPFDEASFDTVVMWEVLEHIPPGTEAIAFKEIARVLRSQGRLYVSTPHASPVARVADPAWWLVKHRHYSRDDLRRFSESAGLTVDQIEVRGGLWEIVYMADLYTSKWVLRRPPLFANAVYRMLDREWLGGPGFTNIFLSSRK